MRTVVLVAVLALVLLGAGGFVANTWFEDRRRARASEAAAVERAREDRATPPVEMAPAPLPSARPLVGPDGVDADGYPLAHVDVLALRSLLWHRRFEDLTAYVTSFQDDFEADPKREYWPEDAGRAFATADPSIDKKLDAWIAHAPDSFAPLLARGYHRYAIGFALRGGAWASKTDVDDMTAMTHAFALARADLAKAISLRPRLVAAVSAMFDMSSATGDRSWMAEAVERADTMCPSCYLVHAVSLIGPRWGGSYAEMAAAAARAQVHVKENPRLRLLLGYVDAEKASDALSAKDNAAADAAIERALAFGEAPRFLLIRADIREAVGDYKREIADAERTLVVRPNFVEPHFVKASALFDLQRYAEAAVALIDGLRVDATHHGARSLVRSIRQGLVLDGWKAQVAGQRDEALRLYNLAAEIAPTDGEVSGRRTNLILGEGEPNFPELEANVASDPDNVRLSQELDYAFAKKGNFQRSLGVWDAFLKRHPDSARAHLERAGAHRALRHPEEAQRDAVAACDLGLTEGCAWARRLGVDL